MAESSSPAAIDRRGHRRRTERVLGHRLVVLRARVLARLFALLLVGLCAASVTWAASTSTRFAATAAVDGATLALNGKGTRYRILVKVYDMALYTTRRVETSQELLALQGPKKLAFVALRELPGTDLGRLFLRGMGDNATSQQLLRHTLASTRLIEVFSGKPKLMPGDTFAMEFVPGKGTTFYIQGLPQGAPVGDDEFFTLVLRIWFGDSPADWKLRDALLDGVRD